MAALDGRVARREDLFDAVTACREWPGIRLPLRRCVGGERGTSVGLYPAQAERLARATIAGRRRARRQ